MVEFIPYLQVVTGFYIGFKVQETEYYVKPETLCLSAAGIMFPYIGILLQLSLVALYFKRNLRGKA